MGVEMKKILFIVLMVVGIVLLWRGELMSVHNI